MSQAIQNKHQILLTGEGREESIDGIIEWLEYLTDTSNLQPALPDLTIYLGSTDWYFLTATVDHTTASLRSLSIQLDFLTEEEAVVLYQEPGPDNKKLRPWIFKLFDHAALEKLDIDFCTLQLPDLFDKLPSLNVVDFSDAKLHHLPPSFYRLPALTFLNISGTPGIEPSNEIRNLQTLRTLKISQPLPPLAWIDLNGLTELVCYCRNFQVPGEMDRLVNLKTLYIASTASVPDTFLDYPLLEKLHIRTSNNTVNAENCSGSLPSLTELDINNPNGFAKTLARFKSLRKLTLSGKLGESSKPVLTESLSQLVNLEYLELEGIGLDDLTWCTSLSNLKYLGVANNSITTIPPGFDNLQKLETINLENNPITTLPQLTTMPAVTFINIKDTGIIDENGMTDIHPRREELKKLKSIFPNVAYLARMEEV